VSRKHFLTAEWFATEIIQLVLASSGTVDNKF
jgi:hypothetical protein